MVFSKTFGYALRGILYIALLHDEKPRIQAEEVAVKLGVPKPFMCKILKMLVKENFLYSVKGPQGGFSINPKALERPLIELVALTDGLNTFTNCILRMDKCNPENPCPMHQQFEHIKNNLQQLLQNTTIQQLLHDESKPDFIKSIATLDASVY